MSSPEKVKSIAIVDRLSYVLIGTYLLYVLIEGWHRL
jgi:hypothetical protein